MRHGLSDRGRRAAAVLSLGCALAGCAVTLSDRVPRPYEPAVHGAPACTASPGRAVADATLAATFIQLGAWWLLSWESSLLPAPPPEVLIPALSLGGAHAASAAYGYNESLRCKRARWRYERSAADERREASPDEETTRERTPGRDLGR